MPFRFRRTLKIAPGVRLNLSKSGVSTSLGARGFNLNLRGDRTRARVGLLVFVLLRFSIEKRAIRP